MREKIAPTYKLVPYKGHLIKDGGHAILTTPKKFVSGRYWVGKPATNKIITAIKRTLKRY